MTAISKRIEKLNKKIEEIESTPITTTKESDGLSFWRGMKIIPAQQWQSIANKKGYEEAIKYIPNGLIKYFPCVLCSENGIDERYEDKRCNKWRDDYYDYLYCLRNPEFGAWHCAKCVLENDNDQEIGSALGLRRIIREIIQSSLKGTEIAAGASSPVTIDYPCPVHNRFQCPYGNSSDIDDPLAIGEVIEEIYNALAYAHMLTYQTRDYTYKVDFNTNRSVETISRYGGWSFSRAIKPIGVELTTLKQPKVPIESVRDIYNALTDMSILDMLLEEYHKHRMKNPKDYGDISTYNYTKRKERADGRRRLIIEWLTEIKDDIKIEYLTNFNGIPLQQEEREQEENAKRSHRDQNMTPTLVDHFNDICCECNKRWACILCINCNKWVCADHQYEHRVKHSLEQEELEEEEEIS